MAPMDVRLMPVADLQPAPYNPRRPLPATARRKLRASLERFGLVEPLVWNERTGHVVGGHARLDILKELGVAEVPVSVVRLTDAEERALNVVLNNQEAQGRYDPRKLTAVLEELRDLPELEATGFGEETLRSLLLEPVAELPAEEPGDRVEVTIEADADTYARLSPRLDALVREFDLVSHVRRT